MTAGTSSKGMMMRNTLLILVFPAALMAEAIEERPTFEEHVRGAVPSAEEIRVFLHEMSWAQFDPDVGYRLGNYMPRDGIGRSSTLSTIQANGARTSFMYRDRPCRINTYGNSFTHCHQVSDGETWQEYLAAHMGEPIRNFGMGGFGAYQAYRRMIREEKTDHQAAHLIFYIWGDDHIRSLLRCRYLLITGFNESTNRRYGLGRMFHGNFWSNLEMDLETAQFAERENLLPTRQALTKMADPDWVYAAVRDDLALQLYLYKKRMIRDLPTERVRRLAECLDCPVTFAPGSIHASVSHLLDVYSLAASKWILAKAVAFAEQNKKKLMVVLFDPSRVMRPMLRGDPSTRYDQEIVDYLRQHEFNTFDMNLVHAQDFKSFNLSVEDYLKRYFIGHYSPAGNHFFAFSIKDRMVDWLDPKPITYQDTDQKMMDFKGYLPD